MDDFTTTQREFVANKAPQFYALVTLLAKCTGALESWAWNDKDRAAALKPLIEECEKALKGITS
jgi:hypothetical protein